MPTETPHKPDTELMFIRQKYDLPPEWRWFLFSSSPDEVPDGMVKYVGNVISSKKNGKPNYQKRDKPADKTVFVVIAEFKVWEQSEADRLGVCVNCWGTKVEWAGWSKEDGTWYRPCRKCSVGTGRKDGTP